jgi:hypothetical protein
MSKICSSASRVLSFVSSDSNGQITALKFIDLLHQRTTKEPLMDVVRHWKYQTYWEAVASLFEFEYWKRIWIAKK